MAKINFNQRMRFQPNGLEVREKEGEESRTIRGKAIVFNEQTVLWDGKYEIIREQIAPSCITKEFLAQQDIKLNLLHERSSSLARNNKGDGTLKLDLREDGLYFEVDLPKCDLGDRALELIRNKTYTGCSFEFSPNEYREEMKELPDGREDILYTHISFKSIDALTIAMDPAYSSTSVSEREMFQKRESEQEAEKLKIKREDEKKTFDDVLDALCAEIN